MHLIIKDFKKGKISYDDLVNPEVMARYARGDTDYLEFILNYQSELSNKLHKSTTQGQYNAIKFLYDRYTKTLNLLPLLFFPNCPSTSIYIPTT